MLASILFELMIITALILANGFFAASELAIVSARRGRLEQLAQAGRRGAHAAIELSEHPNRFLSTVQVGITVISTFAAVFGGAALTDALSAVVQGWPALAPYADTIALGLVVLLISYLSLVIGELVPKRLALQNAEAMSSAVAPLMRVIARLAAPVVALLTGSTELVLRLLGRHGVVEAPVSEDDIIALVREGAAEGTVEATEQELITNVFSFTERTVRSVMTPRTRIVAIEASTPFEAALRMVAESGYSRVPVYRERLDQMLGILYVKDLLHVWGQAEPPAIEALLRPAGYVLESQRAMIAFQQLKQTRGGMALVIDEYGQIVGLITLEDILEEVVGEIGDEYDEPASAIVRRDDGSYLIDGLVPFVDLQSRLGLPDPDDLTPGQDFETLAGLLLALLGHIPTPGERTAWHSYTLEVIDMDGLRIDKILLTPWNQG